MIFSLPRYMRLITSIFFSYEQAHGSPEWLQPTYNLEAHLSQLIGDYCVRKRDGLNNLWILKPWNMARTIDTTVTSNISAIIRLMETGPKICQKYIEHPALFQGRKFDIRYLVLVRSMNPLEIFLADTFWVCSLSVLSRFYLIANYVNVIFIPSLVFDVKNISSGLCRSEFFLN